MITLCVVSLEKGAGKTAICAGIGKQLLGDRKKVSFLRFASEGTDGAANDAAFMKQVLALRDTAESLCPCADNIKETLGRVSAGKDVVIVEGNLNDALARELNAKVIIVEAYTGKPSVESYKGFGESLLGIVINKVPKSRVKHAQEEARSRGITILGIVPEDRSLLAPTIGELADSVGGKILNDAGKSAELVENLLVGALSVDSGLIYFNRKADKAAVIRVDRTDMQLAVLETPTKCVVISGTQTPIYHRVFEKAEAKGIPLVQTDNNTTTILAKIESLLDQARFCQEKKLPRLADILKQSFDFPALNKGLGLAK